MSKKTQIANLIRLARNEMSQVEFAAKIGVKQSSISRYENGTMNPPVRVIEYCMKKTEYTHQINHPFAFKKAT